MQLPKQSAPVKADRSKAVAAAKIIPQVTCQCRNHVMFCWTGRNYVNTNQSC